MEKRPRRFSLREAFFEGDPLWRARGLSEHETVMRRGKRDGKKSGQREDCACGVPQRREKGLGNGVKNLSGSADIPKLPSQFITRLEMHSLALLTWPEGDVMS